jgi:hypothetical protein
LGANKEGRLLMYFTIVNWLRLKTNRLLANSCHN